MGTRVYSSTSQCQVPAVMTAPRRPLPLPQPDADPGSGSGSGRDPAWTASLRKSYPHLFRPLPWSEVPTMVIGSATPPPPPPPTASPAPSTPSALPARPPSTSVEVEAFSKLLAYDPRAYAAANGYQYALKDSGLSHEDRQIVPLDGNTGIAGKYGRISNRFCFG